MFEFRICIRFVSERYHHLSQGSEQLSGSQRFRNSQLESVQKTVIHDSTNNGGEETELEEAAPQCDADVPVVVVPEGARVHSDPVRVTEGLR